MYAIYARQSVEKKDSISVEMQIDLCKTLLPPGSETEIFTDRGYSGKNVNRPSFQRMLHAIRRGEFSGVVVYKLDRISRSLSDFLRLSGELEAQGVQLLSYGERFDTSSPMGMMLVKLLIMFAEMEQKTIAARIRDNYIARAEKGMPLGIAPPFGYDREWQRIPVEAETIEYTFQQYLCGKSSDCIAALLNTCGKRAKKGGYFTGMQVGRMLRNPAYVRSSAAVYAYFQRMGAQLPHPAENYCTGCGCLMVHSGTEQYILAGTHEGIIPADVWLAVQERRNAKKARCNGGSGTKSWLQGLVLCGKCGESCYVRSSSAGAPYVYFVCRGKRRGTCAGLHAVRTAEIEAAATAVLQREMERILSEECTPPQEEIVQLGEIEGKIQHLLRGIASEPAMADSAEEALRRLYRQREALHPEKWKRFHNSTWRVWKELDFQQKKAAAHIFLEKILLTEERMTIIFR